jgi:hypothetical protein
MTKRTTAHCEEFEDDAIDNNHVGTEGTRSIAERRSRQLRPAIISASGDINALVSLLTLGMPLPEGRGSDANVHFNRELYNTLLRRDSESTRAFWKTLSALESEA